MTILYTILVWPIEILVGFIFFFVYRFRSCGDSIIAVSLTISFLCLPLYYRADAIQEKERQKQKETGAWKAHIQRTFHGDERFMMLSAYYRESGYKPVYALRGSLSLLLQIPFFIAAYHFLSHADVLQGASYGILSDLGKPDGLASFAIGGVVFRLNILPIAMTGINLLSGFVYLKGFSLRDKLQSYILACVFLFLLYGSPSGLVLYWTMNNLFSLGKNLYHKYAANCPKLSQWLLAFGGVLVVIAAKRGGMMYTARRTVLFIGVFCLLCIPLLCDLLGLKPGESAFLLRRIKAWKGKEAGMLFLQEMLLFTLLVGLLIPSAVIASSPAEFIQPEHFVHPLGYVWSTLCVSAGTFLVWFLVVRYTAGGEGKAVLSCMSCALGTAAVCNYMFFGRGRGILSAALVFDEEVKHRGAEDIGNLLLCVGVLLLFFLFGGKYQRMLKKINFILLFSILVLGIKNTAQIARDVSGMSYLQKTGKKETGNEKIFTLSREGRNIIVLMLDRAISGYVPYLFDEKQDLKEKFEGFTYYPNTVSYGKYTNFGAPALYGGYEYTPRKINDRREEALAEKHNEALKVLPVLFSQEGYKTTVCDPAYAGYQWVPDLSIYDEYPSIFAVNLTQGRFFRDDANLEGQEMLLKKKFFCYGIFKIAPTILQRFLYDYGNYYTESLYDWSFQHQSFVNSYMALSAMEEITGIEETKEDTFLLLTNCTTHEPCSLELPDYTIPTESGGAMEINDTPRVSAESGRVLSLSTVSGYEHYCVNMAAFLQLGKWFDYLRENGVYDNTRIVIAADHGKSLGQFEELLLNEEVDIEGVNPLLMYKDFGAKEFAVSEEFMTNADTPALAVKDVIENPVNPFTGKTLDNAAKYTERVEITLSDLWDVDDNNGNTFIDDGSAWYSVHDNIFEKENWEKLR